MHNIWNKIMQKLTQDKGLVSKCKYQSRLVLIELTLGISSCESNSRLALSRNEK